MRTPRPLSTRLAPGAPVLCDEKLCYRCKTAQPRSSFWKARSRRDGLQPMCKLCYMALPTRKSAYARYRKTAKYKEMQKRYLDSDKGRATRRRYDEVRKRRGRADSS